jgi:hypothetical protein
MNEKLQPKCLNDKDLGYSATGHITPCCWANVNYGEPYLEDLFAPELHIDNFEKIEDIFQTDSWKKFIDMLKNNSENAPPTCKRFCTVSLEEDIEGTTTIFNFND